MEYVAAYTYVHTTEDSTLPGSKVKGLYYKCGMRIKFKVY